MNALLGYGTSSSSESEEEGPEEKKSEECTKPKLPKPTLGETSELQTSVFSNPFAQAELAKAAILEKHVKMAEPHNYHVGLMIIRNLLCPFLHTIVKYIGDDCKVPGQKDTLTINGKKICWNYRKGRCRFGHKCQYAHDSDLQKTPEELEADKQKLYNQYTSLACESSGTQSSAPPPLEPISPTDDEVWEQGPDRKKARRPGLSKGLVPGKKVIQMYKDLKKKDGNKSFK